MANTRHYTDEQSAIPRQAIQPVNGCRERHRSHPIAAETGWIRRGINSRPVSHSRLSGPPTDRQRTAGENRINSHARCGQHPTSRGSRSAKVHSPNTREVGKSSNRALDITPSPNVAQQDTAYAIHVHYAPESASLASIRDAITHWNCLSSFTPFKYSVAKAFRKGIRVTFDCLNNQGLRRRSGDKSKSVHSD